MSADALKGFKCMAVYAEPASSDEAQSAQAEAVIAAAAASSGSKRKRSTAAAAAPTAPPPLVRYLYYKSHVGNVSGSDDAIKAGCTLFVVNVPPFFSSEHLTQLFACFGAVEQVHFLQSGPAATLATQLDRVGAVQPSEFYRSAHVVYESADSVQMAVRTDLSRMPQQCPEEADDESVVGVKRWLSAYHSSHPDVSSLQLQVDRFMEGFDARSVADRAAARAGAEQDADGWTLVKSTQRGTKRALLAREEETERAAVRAAKKARQNTVLHFYKHHEREAKKERLVALRDKFEQDKLKIAKMKADRKFKPY